MTPSEYQEKLLKTIEAAVEKFNGKIPDIEKQAMDRILALTKELEVKNGSIVNSAANLKKIGQLRSMLEGAIINDKLADALQKFVDSFNVVADIHRKYFGAMDERKPSEILKELQLQAKEAVINKLTGEIDIRLIPAVEEILRTSITSGGSYQSLQYIMQDFIIGSKTIEGSYAKLSNLAVTITVDSLNTFSAQYSKQLTESLNLQWRMYVGSNLTTTREWCDWMTKKKYVHTVEYQDILKGRILDHQVKIREKTGLWDGAKEGTDATNIDINRGGWKCGHQFLAVPEASVPVQIRIDTYNKYGIPHVNGKAKI